MDTWMDSWDEAKIEIANQELEDLGSDLRVGYNPGSRYPYHVARADGKRKFLTYMTFSEVNREILLLLDKEDTGTWY